MPDRLPSLVLLVAFWIPPAVVGRAADASMLSDGAETFVATMLSTIMAVRDRPDIVG